jgi:broad specificity phosphatase PhoE
VNFGLVNQTYSDLDDDCEDDLTQWQQFDRELLSLNKNANHGIAYKLLFLGRHGEGWHNAAETFYTTPAWNCYYSLIQGNATANWDDAHLTSNGVKQAQTANAFWATRIKLQKITTPQSFYTSPLARCLETSNITWSGLDLGKHKFIPTVKEYLREGISLHTCDHRSNKTWIRANYPSYKIENGFSEFDPLFNGITSESPAAQDLRSKAVLDDIFLSDKSTVISITSHSGGIASILRVLDHIPFSLSTGAIIPVLVKAEYSIGPTSMITGAPWTTSGHCTVSPMTSISTGSCVCPSSAALVITRLVTETPVVSPILTFTPTSRL